VIAKGYISIKQPCKSTIDKQFH